MICSLEDNQLTRMSSINTYVSSVSFVLLILYLFGVSFSSIFSFFQFIFGSGFPLQRHSILMDFCFEFFVIFGFSNAGANLSNCSKLALSPTNQTKQKSFQSNLLQWLTSNFNRHIRYSYTNFI
jgi:hypothetical protein